MRIAVFYNLLACGAKRTILESVRGLVGRGHTVDVYTLSCSDQDYCDVRPFANGNYTFAFRPLPLARSPFGRVNQIIRALDLARLRRVERSMATVINERNYDVVFVNRCYIGWSPIIKYLRAPSVYYCQDPLRNAEPPILRPYDHRGWRQTLDRLDPLPRMYITALEREARQSYHAATVVLANSYYVRESLLRVYGGQPLVFYQGVDTKEFQPSPRDRARVLRVLSVGQVSRHKGFDLIIRGLACVPQSKRPPFTIVGLTGLQEEKAWLEDLATANGVRVEFLHAVTGQQLIDLYRTSVLTAFTPHLEPFGLIPLESMACGTPVVGIKEGGVRETILDGETGFLVDRDPQQFAEAVVRLVSDPNLVEEMGARGRQHVLGKWDWACAADRLERHLLRSAGKGHTPDT